MAIARVLDGTIQPRNYLLGFNENGIGLAGFGKFQDRIGAENHAKIRQLIQDIRAGKVTDLPKVR
jgi:basic membrane protein A